MAEYKITNRVRDKVDRVYYVNRGLAFYDELVAGTDGKLYDNQTSGQVSIDWFNRTLNDSSTLGIVSIDYQNRSLYGTDGSVKLDWRGNKLYKDWYINDRLLIARYGSLSETLSGAAYIQGNSIIASNIYNNIVQKTSNDAGQFIRMRYDKGITFHTGLNGSIGDLFSDDDNQRFSINNSGEIFINNSINSTLDNNLSIDSNNRTLKNSAGVITLDWNNPISGGGTTYTGTNGIVVSGSTIGLPLSGVSPSSYNFITVNNRGIITSATNRDYITNQTLSLSGDISGSGSSGISTTLATVNSNIGSFNYHTVNAKGLTTSASNKPYLTGNQTITVTGDVTGSGSTGLALTLPTVNSNVGTFNSVTVNAKGQVTAASNTASTFSKYFGTNGVVVSGNTIGLPLSGVLASTYNFLTVNNRGIVTAGQAKNYITGNQTISVTGDATGSGSNAISLTLATVNSNVGTFNSFTVNGKGLITAATAKDYYTNQTITLTGDVTGSGSSGLTTAIGTNKVTNTMIRQSVGLSVVGRSVNSTGNVADIVASSDGQVLKRVGGVVGFNQIGTNDIADSSVTFAKVANLTQGFIIGRYSVGSGVTQAIQIGNGLILNSSTGVLTSDKTNQVITLTGDITGSGSSGITTTLPNINANVGTFNSLTVNAKGQVTAASNVASASAITQGTNGLYHSGRTVGLGGTLSRNTSILLGGKDMKIMRGSTNSIDFGNTKLYSSSGLLKHDYGRNILYNNNLGYQGTSANFDTGILYRSLIFNQPAINLNQNTLIDSNGITAMRWSSGSLRSLLDGSGVAAVDFGNARNLRTAANNIVYNYGTNIINRIASGISSTSANFNSGILFSNSQPSINWNSRSLIKSSLVIPYNWNSNIFFYNNSSTSGNIDQGALYYKINGSSAASNIVSVDYNRGQLRDFIGQVSVDYNNYALRVQGTQVLDWGSGFTIYDSSKGTSIMTTRTLTSEQRFINALKIGTTRISWSSTNSTIASTNGTVLIDFKANDKIVVRQDLQIGTLGKGLKIKEGTGAKMGISTLVAGTVVVSNTSITSTSRIFLTCNVVGGTPGFLRVSTRSVGTSFTILSSSGTDTSAVAWMLVEPAS